MKYNKQDLIDMAKEANFVETYEYVCGSRHIHTDTVKYIGNSDFDNSEIDALPFDKNGEVDADVRLMGREDYEHTLLANSSESWDDYDEYDDDTKILVIVVK